MCILVFHLSFLAIFSLKWITAICNKKKTEQLSHVRDLREITFLGKIISVNVGVERWGVVIRTKCFCTYEYASLLGQSLCQRIRAQVVSAPMYTLFIYATCAPRAVAIKILNVTRSMNMSKNMKKVWFKYDFESY